MDSVRKVVQDYNCVRIYGKNYGMKAGLPSGFCRRNGHVGHAHNHDQNLRAAYIHVITDAITSVAAIIPLVLGLLFGIVRIDALMGFPGSLVIILTDYTPASCDLIEEITRSVEADKGSRINDLHIWQVSPGKYAAIVSIEAESPKTLEEYHAGICIHEELVHTTIQIMKTNPEQKPKFKEAVIIAVFIFRTT